MNNTDRDNGPPAAGPRTDLNELANFLHLPRRPVSAIYLPAVRGVVGLGPTDWELTALLTFEPADAEAIVREAAPRPRPDVDRLVPHEHLSWFPPAARPFLVESSAGDGYELAGEAYDVEDFILAPLTEGQMIRVGTTPHLYLSLYTT